MAVDDGPRRVLGPWPAGQRVSQARRGEIMFPLSFDLATTSVANDGVSNHISLQPTRWLSSFFVSLHVMRLHVMRSLVYLHLLTSGPCRGFCARPLDAGLLL